MKKKLLSLLLVATIMMTPFASLILASAEELTISSSFASSISQTSFSGKSEDVSPLIDSGKCGENVEWELHESGLLYFYGQGKMDDWSEYYTNLTTLAFDCTTPWYDLRSKVKTVEIESGITSLGEYAFNRCSNLSKVSLPESIDTISKAAFRYCESLTSLELPDSIRYIDEYAFLGCTGITAVKFPKKVTRISYYAFRDCTNLKTIQLPSSISSIWQRAFLYCKNLSEIYFEGDKPSLYSGAFGSFESVTATVYYPKNNSTWDNIDKLWDGGGNMKFFAYSPQSEITESDTDSHSDPEPTVSTFIIDKTVSGKVNEEIKINGNIALDIALYGKSDKAEEIITSAIENINWTFDDNKKAEIVSFTPTYSSDYTSANLDLVVKPLESGTINLTGTTSNELTSSCKITVVSETANETKTFTEGTVNIDFRTDTNDDQTLTHGFYYSDSFFEEKSTVYNHDLAKMTLGLVLAGFSSGGSDEYWSVETTETKDDNNRSKNIVKAYKELGFNVEDIKLYNYNVSLNDSSDKVAFSIAHKTITVNGNKKNLVAVILRGGGYGAEWASNFNMGNNGAYHAAFNNAASDVVKELNKYLSDYNLTNNVKIWIGGYSRSAAVSNLAAAKLDRLANGGDLYSINRDNIYTYTFATPQGVIDNKTNDIHNSLYNNIFNIVNPCDVVPTVALSKWDFGRYGQSLTLPYLYIHTSDLNLISSYKSYEYSKAKKVSSTYSLLTAQNIEILPAFDVSIFDVSQIDTALYKLSPNTNIFVDDKYQNIITKILQLIYTNDLYDDIKSDHVKDNKVINNLRLIYGSKYYNINNCMNQESNRITYKLICKLCPSMNNTLRLALAAILDYESGNSDKIVFNIIHSDLFKLLEIKVFNSASGLGDNHYPELYLSWLESYDAKELFGNRTYKKITASCPVNVDIYSSDRTLLASVVDGEVVEELIPVYLDNDSKEIWFIDEDDYDIVITAYDDGKMTYSVEEYNQDFDLQNKTNFYDINLEKGNTYETTVSLSNSSDSQQENTTVLDKNNNVSIEPSEVINPDNSNSYVDVTVSSDENGYVYGNQTVIKGEYVSVSATAKEGYRLKGWYLNKTLVSTDETYYFTAKEDTNLNAVFVKDIFDTDSDVDSDTKKNTDTDTNTDSDIKKDSDNDTDSNTKNPTKPDKPKDPTSTDTNKMGDLDNDGKITSADSLLILRQSVGLEHFTDVQQKLADVDDDGKITSADALEVLRYSVGLSVSEKIGKLIITE